MNTSRDDVVKAIAKPEQPADNPWPERLESWNKFSEKFHERGCKIEQRYEDERDVANQVTQSETGGKKVNMFYSNTTVIKESLYNSLPKPTVGRLHQSDFENEPSRVAASIMERGLSYEVRCAHYFDPAIKSAILDRLVPGMGTVWINFQPARMERGKQVPESISVDIVYWKDFIFEPQRAWEQVTWAGRILHVDTAVAKERWGEGALEAPGQKHGQNTSVDQAVNLGKVSVIEMWDKNTNTVIFMTPQGTILKTAPDPYQLINFFPTPKPLIASPATRKFLPMPEYYMAQDQYLELDVIYARINLIIEAVKVAGVYDSSVPEIGRMLSGAENKLIPVDNWAMFADKGGAKGVIDWFPIDQITAVLQQLISTYEFVKTQLFEVTGMADIIRGSSNQYETAAAQQIKAQYASVRMNAFQRDVAIFVRDSVRIMGELMAQLYTDQKLSLVCGQLPEVDQQYVQAALAILRDDFASKYNVDIQTDSLTQADWALQQEQRMTYVQTLSQFLQAAVPAAQQTPEIAPLLIQMVKFASVGFKGASELEGTLDSILAQLAQAAQNPQPKPPSPEEIKAKAEEAKVQADMQAKQQDAQIKQQESQAKMAERAQELQFKREEHQMEMQFQQQKHAQEMQFMREKAQLEAAVKVAHDRQEAEQNEQRFEDERFQDDVRLEAEIAAGGAKTEAQVAGMKAKEAAKPPKPKGGKT